MVLLTCCKIVRHAKPLLLIKSESVVYLKLYFLEKNHTIFGLRYFTLESDLNPAPFILVEIGI